MPTLRQKIATKKISEIIRNTGTLNINFGQVLLESGYAESVSKKPQLVIRARGFQDLLDKELNRDLIPLKTQIKLAHSFLLNQSDNLSAKAKAIDIYYKMTGEYRPDEASMHCKKCESRKIFEDMTTEELDQAIKTEKLHERCA